MVQAWKEVDLSGSPSALLRNWERLVFQSLWFLDNNGSRFLIHVFTANVKGCSLQRPRIMGQWATQA